MSVAILAWNLKPQSLHNQGQDALRSVKFRAGEWRSRSTPLQWSSPPNQVQDA
ncbi:MAG: hypothetical protein IGR92_17070 [Leptolyngbyaceae cyanobacterium T60_A2020_046]|nr:hypothetical protein [Leptolyngbyaceae cyanobacterium T60_A2020_046]